MSCTFEEEIARNSRYSFAESFLEGIDIAHWAVAGKEGSPEMSYLETLPCSIVLTFTIQLACFRYCWVKNVGNFPDGVVPSAGAVGHSQGMAAAMVVAAATDVDTFEHYAGKFGRLLMAFGVFAAQSLAKQGFGGSCALAVLKAPVSAVVTASEQYAELAEEGLSIPSCVVTNGASACVMMGPPASCAAFETWLQEPKRFSGKINTRLLPIHAPFHCSQYMGEAFHNCAAWFAETGWTSTSAASLVRPLWSCVDGRRLEDPIPNLEVYLLESLAMLPVDWPKTLQTISDSLPSSSADSPGRPFQTRVVDYGPGGGTGARYLSTQVCKERSLANLYLDYFSQRHGVEGPLPQSWLAWTRSSEARPEGENAQRGSGKKGGGSVEATSTKGERAFTWFSERLKRATEGAPVIEWTPHVLASIDLELQKVRAGRASALEREYPIEIQTRLNAEAWHHLRREQTHSFDTSRHRLLESFTSLLKVPDGSEEVNLNALHRLFHADQGTKRDRRQKTAMLEGLRDPVARQPFLEAYESLILETLAPWVAEKMDCDRVVFQSFPCVRCHRPGEFSIGPHCDAQYQLPEGNLNCYLPLTAIWDTNSLYLESEPGEEDFHPLVLDYGEVSTFHGCMVTHFAVENMTKFTRVSLDFRVIPGDCYPVDVEQQLPDFKVGGYYSECSREGPHLPFVVGRRGIVNHRHGFPHTST